MPSAKPQDGRDVADADGVTHVQVNEASRVHDGRWAEVGSSTEQDSFAAGARAAAAASAQRDASLYLVFAGQSHEHEQLIAGVASEAHAGAVVVGCTTGGEITADGPTDGGVVVMALGGPGVSTAVRCADIVGGDLRTAGEWAADALWDVEDRGHTVLLLLADGHEGDPRDIARGARASAGETVPLVGGCAAGSNPVIFHATSAETRLGGAQVVGVAISSVEPLGVGVSEARSPIDAAEQALASLNGPPVGVLAFGCAERRFATGPSGALDEIRLLERRVGVPVAGFYAAGEFARAEGGSGFHTEALAMLAIG